MKILSKENIIVILFVLLISTLCLSVSKCSRYKGLYEYANNAYCDTITQYVNKNKELYTANLMYISNISDLKKTNQDLYDEVKTLKDNPIVVTKIKTVYERDTVTIEAPITIDTANGNFESIFDYNDEWSEISGTFNGNIYTSSGLFSLNSLKFNCEIISDIIEKDGQLYFISKSSNPYMTISNTQGTILSPEKSKALKQRFNKPWGIMIGAGLSAVYIDNSLKIVPALQITAGYKILSF